MQLTEGMIVKSVCGHDQNRFYVILRVEDDFVYIADGKLRRATSPKKKNAKHVAVTGQTVDITQVHTDKKLRKALWPYNYDGEQPPVLPGISDEEA